MKKQIINLCFLVSLLGCSQKSATDTILATPPTPPLSPNIIPPTPPPPLTPTYADVQINRIPHPFNLNGHRPYVIWVDGKKLNLNPIETRALANSLNLKFTQPKDTAEIHNGNGWQRPLRINRDKSDIQSFFEEEVFIDVE